MNNDHDEFEGEPEEIARPRDGKIDAAKQVLMERFFPDDGTGVFYGRQLEIWLEEIFFHWITKKALNELAAEGRVRFAREQVAHHVAHFYWPKRHRYPRRQVRRTIALIAELSDPEFTHAVGQHGELLAAAGFAYAGFRIRQRKVREVDGKVWTKSGHDLDYLVERHGERYGVEVKNQLAYIGQEELETKIAMCEYFGVRPLFVARMMPKSYIFRTQQAGGFSLILRNQHYPMMAGGLAERVRGELRLPVLVIRELPNTTMDRFERWHEREVGKDG